MVISGAMLSFALLCLPLEVDASRFVVDENGNVVEVPAEDVVDPVPELASKYNSYSRNDVSDFQVVRTSVVDSREGDVNFLKVITVLMGLMLIIQFITMIKVQVI